MFKNNISQFNDLCPMEVLKAFIESRIKELEIYGIQIKKIDWYVFTKLDRDFMAGCLIAHYDYDFDFLFNADEFFDIKKLIVKFMVSPAEYQHNDFLLVTKIKQVCVDAHFDEINNLIEEIKNDIEEARMESMTENHNEIN